MVTHERNPLLVENIALLRESFRYAKTKFDFRILEIVILPDHLHMIIEVPMANTYPKIISSIKRHFSKHCDTRYYQHLWQSAHREKSGYYPVWQKRYFEHTIRNDKDYQAKAHYIHTNPIKHGYTNDIGQWKYGSFHKKLHSPCGCNHVAKWRENNHI
jgi:putative transposase